MWLRHHSEQKAPEWCLPGAMVTPLMDGGCLVNTTGIVGSAPSRGWVDAGDGWEMRLLDDEMPPHRDMRDDPDQMVRIQTPDGTWCPVQMVQDLRGRPWPVPIVVRADGASLLQLPLVRGEDGWSTEATVLQRRILTAARFFVDLSDAYRAGHEIELQPAADSAVTLLSTGCWCSETGLANAGLMDEHLINRVWIACMGGVVDDGQAA